MFVFVIYHYSGLGIRSTIDVVKEYHPGLLDSLPMDDIPHGNNSLGICGRYICKQTKTFSGEVWLKFKDWVSEVTRLVIHSMTVRLLWVSTRN